MNPENSASPAHSRSTDAAVQDWARRRHDAVEAVEENARVKQHGKGKGTARERVEQLLDAGSFVEMGEFALHRSTSFGMDSRRVYGDGVVTGHGTVDGRRVCVFSQDFTVFGGSMGEVFGEKVLAVMDLALRIGCPVVGINDSGGARIQEGVVSLAYYAELGRRNALASGVVPQISLIMGPCAGGAVYSPAMTDFTVMVENTSHMFVTGPEVVSSVTGQDTTAEELGGPSTNAQVSGNAHYVAEDEDDALDWVRTLLGYLPGNHLEEPPSYATTNVGNTADDGVSQSEHDLDELVPDSPNASYDVTHVFRAVLDDEDYLEIQADFAPNMRCVFGRLDGRTVGVVANQPACQAGILDIDASEKAARFVRFCDAFGVPVVTFTDVPGYLPGVQQERSGIIRRGAKLIYAYSEATVPKVTVVLRKAYGGGYAVMGSKHVGADVNLAWPTAEIAVMGAEGAVGVLYRRELAEAAEQGNREEVRAKLAAEYRDTTATPYVAAERGYVDAVIRPAHTRGHLVRALRMLAAKSSSERTKKHDCMPL